MKHSFFLKLFLALALLVVAPTLILSWISHNQMLMNTEKEISRTAISQLQVVRSMNGLVADNLLRDVVRLSLDSTVNDLREMQQLKDVQHDQSRLLQVMNSQKILAEYVRTNSMYDSVYIFMDHADYVLTTNQGIVHRDEFRDTGWLGSYKAYKNDDRRLDWISTRVLPDTGRRVMTYIYPLMAYTAMIDGAIVVNVNEREFNRLISQDERITSGMMIVDHKGNMITHPDSGKPGTNVSDAPEIKRILDSEDSEGYFVTGSTHGKQLMTYYKSDFNQWIYISSAGIDQLMAPSNQAMQRLVYLAGILLAVGLVVSFIISRILYNPFKRLLTDIQRRRGIDIRGNEMAVLSGVFDSLIRQETRLFSLAGGQEDGIRNACLLKMLKKGRQDNCHPETGSDAFIDPWFTCVLLQIDRPGTVFADMDDEKRDQLLTVVQKTAEAWLGQTGICAGARTEDQRIAMILNTAVFPDVLRITGCITSLQNDLEQALGITVSAAIGLAGEGVGYLPVSLRSAEAAFRFRILYEAGCVISASDRTPALGEYFYPHLYEKHILNAVQAGVEERMEASVDEFIEHVRSVSSLTSDNVVQIFNQLLGQTIKFLLESGNSIQEVFGSGRDLYQEFNGLENIQEIRQWLYQVFGTMIRHKAGDKAEGHNYYDAALRYIHKNYREDIDINRIAEHIGISYSHLRRIFKDETGDNLVNFINNLRITESKQLLCETDMTVKNISMYLGYHNEQSFMRFFKKYEGISPGEFRTGCKGKARSV